MKLGSFLLGGIVGAAAVVYLNNKSKSMLFSAFNSNNQSVGNMMDKAKDKFAGTSDSAVNHSFDSKMTHSFDNKATHKPASTATTASTNAAFNKEEAFGGLGAVEQIIKKDPELNLAVQDILSQNNKEKEAFQTQ